MFKEFIENSKGKTVNSTTFGYFLFCSDFAKELGILPDLKDILINTFSTLGVVFAGAAIIAGSVLLTSNNGKK